MKGLVPVDNDRRGRPREHSQLPIPGEALWVMTSLPVKRPHQGGCCATFGCACAHPREPLSGSRDLRSLPVAMELVLLYYILYYYYSSSTKCTCCACAEHTSGSDQDLFRSRDWRHFRSRDFRGRHFRSGPLPVAPPPQMPFELCWYTTYAISAYHDWCCEFD